MFFLSIFKSSYLLKYIVAACFSFIFSMPIFSQTINWPTQTWTNATNLTPKMNQTDLIELSGLHWNPETKRLYVVQDNGRLRVLQFNAIDNDYIEIANTTIDGNPEGIMQVDNESTIFYTVDEKKYEIRQYAPNQNFTSVPLMKKWRLLTPNTPMPDTGNDGIEGIVFVPDEYLQAIGFVSSETGLSYTSTKGMGGLVFVAHQTEGYIWVYDVNPDLSFDVEYVGKYVTNRKESCDLAFDRTTGLLYILHNIGKNFLEVTDLSLEQVSGEYKFVTLKEYSLSNPTDGNDNIEGFAITPMCESNGQVSVFLCRDVNSSGTEEQKADVLRLFTGFPSLGTCPPSTSFEVQQRDNSAITIEIHPSKGLYLHGVENDVMVTFVDVVGTERYKGCYKLSTFLPIEELPTGVSILQIHTSEGIQVMKIWL